MALLENRERRSLPVQVSSAPSRGLVSSGKRSARGRFRYCVVCVLLLGCESKAVIAAWSCPQSSESSTTGAAGSMGAGGSSDAFPLPWSSGFENGWCDFNDGRGGFIETGTQVKEVVTEPVHSGSFAAAFTVNGSGGEGGQLRGIRWGQMPSAAYYGAWYFVPKLAKNTGLWNLFHFQGDNEEIKQGHLWDISLVNNDDGDLRLNVFSYLFGPLPDQAKIPPIPIGSWFHIEMYWKRAKDESGEVTVYQDGAVIFQLRNTITDNSNNWVQWYVGNLANNNLAPSEFTVYVDDVTIDTQR